MAIAPSRLSTQLGPKSLPGSPEALTLARWICRSYKKSKSRKGNNRIAEQILENVPESCRVRIISEGKEVNRQMLTMMSSPSPRVAPPNSNDHNDNHQIQTPMPLKEDQDHHQNGPVSCNCFKPMFK
ncbi:hypothetical protein K1719_005260 [Acacia pycnantha]|nr:hypothetical protein K1719_005260 [Acacia pycnantha]